MTHVWISEPDHHWIRSWFVTWSASSHNWDHYWSIVLNLLWESQKMYILNNFTAMRWQRLSKSLLVEDKDLLILHIQCHCCWWPGDARVEGINGHGIEIVLLNGPISVSEGLQQTFPRSNQYLPPKHSHHSGIDEKIYFVMWHRNLLCLQSAIDMYNLMDRVSQTHQVVFTQHWWGKHNSHHWQTGRNEWTSPSWLVIVTLAVWEFKAIWIYLILSPIIRLSVLSKDGHNRHPIAHMSGWDLVCPLSVQSLIYVPPVSLQNLTVRLWSAYHINMITELW